jgi:carbon-monoxide dehydrogenase small subunit
MTINFTLNGEEITTNIDSSLRLLDILQRDYGLSGAKSGCRAGRCGLCLVKFNGELAAACLLPAFRLRGSEIITIEGFRQLDEYMDIEQGFKKADCSPCSACYGAKVLITDTLLEKSMSPASNELSDHEILEAFDGIRCRCTDPLPLIAGVRAAIEERRRRLG